MMGKSTVQGLISLFSEDNEGCMTLSSFLTGWGAFVQGECKEDDFLGEYTGDLISQVTQH
jgi:hypothetical protein